MTAARVVPYIVATVALVIAAYSLGSRQAAPVRADLGKLEQRIGQLERRIGASTDRRMADPGTSSLQSMPATALASRTGGADAMHDGSSGGRPPTAAEIARVRAARRTALDAAFRNDPIDLRGGGQAEGKLSDAAVSDDLVQSGTTPIAIDTQCRLDSCRVITRFPANSDAEGWANIYVLSAAGTLASAETVITPLPDGSTELAIYGTRQ